MMTQSAPALARSPHSNPDIPWRERPFLPLKTAALLLGVSSASVYRLEAEGQLKFRRIAGRTLVDGPSLSQYVDAAATDDWAPSEQGAAAREKRRERAKAGWRD